MFVSQPIGFVSSPYQITSEIPKGPHAKHEAEGELRILPEFEIGLTDIEGFSHLFVIWEFHRAQSFDLIGTPAFRRQTARSVCDSISPSSQPHRPHGCDVASP